MGASTHIHAHGHSHASKRSTRHTTRVMLVSLALTVGFVVVEAAAGLRSGSLALLSDAGHNFTDAFALLLAAFGVYLQARPSDQVKTYGYQRAGVLAAFVNALVLAALAAVLFYESYQRLMQPEPVGEITMMAVAAGALVLNLGIAFLLGEGGGHHHDLNVRAAWIHMAGDAASSAAIIVGAIVIRLTGWLVIDPVLSILIGVMILWSAWGIIRDTLNILLEGLPKGLQLTDVAGAMSGVPGVIEVHDLHVWCLGSESRALSCHVLIEDVPPSASESILRTLNGVLGGQFAIHHTTIQFEHSKCALAETRCSVVSHHPHVH